MKDPEMTLCTGRPQVTDGRLPKEIACYDLLDKLQILYWRVDHTPRDTIAACEEIDEIMHTKMCKNLFLCNRQKTAFYLLLIDGDKSFRTSSFSKLLGVSRLSFGDAEHMASLLDLTPGSVSVLGLMNVTERQVQLVIDRDVAQLEYHGCHPCINTSSLKLRTTDLLEKFLPAVGHTPMILDLPKEEPAQE